MRTTIPGPDGYVIPGLLGQRFRPGPPNVAWCQDITYIPTGQSWLFLASVLDLGSRRLIGYAMAEHMRTELVLDALNMGGRYRRTSCPPDASSGSRIAMSPGGQGPSVTEQSAEGSDRASRGHQGPT